MAFFDTTWYLNSVGWTAVTAWAANTAYTVGQLRRQNAAPAVGSERVFVCIIAGTSHLTTEPTWVLTRGAKTTDNTVTWQECTGASAVNGDLTNTPNWTTVKNISVTLGQIIKRNNAVSYQICSTAGTTGNGAEPAFSDTAGTTTADNTVTWTSLGAVGTYTGGQGPHARLGSVFGASWFAAGNTCYVGANHAEAQTAQNNTIPTLGTDTFSYILCHDQAGPYPPAAANLSTGAVVSTSAAATVLLFVSGAGYLYVRGVTFRAGVGAAGGDITLGTGSNQLHFELCTFELANSGSSAVINVGSGSAQVITWVNCQVKFADISQRISAAGGNFTWKKTSQALVTGSSVPTNLMLANIACVQVLIDAVDLSQCSGAILQTSSTTFGNFIFRDCKLHASATVNSPQAPTQTFQFIRCDSSTGAYKSSRYHYDGTEITETSITRVGGASDPNGQAQSRKITTTAKPAFLRPFNAQAVAIWNPVTGANVTVTVCGTINSASLPNNDEIWMDVEYLGTAGGTTGIIATSTKATVLTAAAAVASDGSSWNGGGSGAGWSPFKLVVQLDTTNNPQPQIAGYINVRVCVAKRSVTYYLDPMVVLS